MILKENIFIESYLLSSRKRSCTVFSEMNFRENSGSGESLGNSKFLEIKGDLTPRGYSVFRDIGGYRKTSHSAFLAQPRYSTLFTEGLVRT